MKNFFKKFFEKKYSYDEVKNILCEGCRMNLSSLRNVDEQKWFHTINGNIIDCDANEWRNQWCIFRLDQWKEI